VFERADRVGGLLTYGIPDFKMEKTHVDRRVDQMKAEGVTLQHQRQRRRQRRPRRTHEGVRRPRPLRRIDRPTRSAHPRPRTDGVEFAMDFLPQQNRRVAGLKV
jgi:glutamate synthase (NADPH) small chain